MHYNYDIASTSDAGCATLMKIAPNNENTNACIVATSNHWTNKINGTINGRSNPINDCTHFHTPTVSNHNNTVPASILPYSLNANDIIFATIPTTSSIPINIDTTISNSFANGRAM